MGRKPKSTADNDNMMTLFDDEEFTETENTVEKDSQEEDTSTNEAEVTREEEVTDNNDELTENGTEEDITSANDAEDSAESDDGDDGEGNGDSEESAPADVSQALSLDDVMSGELEEDGALTLARYASRAYLEYAMSVVKSRALPEVTDGQKPVQRRILIDMDRMGLKAGNKVVKSARVVGDVLGKYHPHGDQSVYDAMVRMAQDFSLRYPLVDGKGNFGSRDGDSQAAMRYTEARLMPIADLLLEEVDTGAVDFVPNYDGNFNEPVALPAKLPFVLLMVPLGLPWGWQRKFRPTT